MSTQTAVAAPAAPKPIDTVRHALEKMQGQFAMALPKHITPERMVRIALTAIQNTPKLLDCDRQSLYSAIMRAAQLGLEPDGVLGQAYLIPFGKTVQFIPGYKGLIDLARRSGEVSNIIAKEVYFNDEFEVDWALEIPFSHKPLMEGDRGEVTHFWAMARFKDGGFHWDYLTRKEVENIRDRSQGKNNAVWKDHFIEMGKKTAIRRIAKYLPMSVQRAAMTEDLIDRGQKFSTTEMGDIILEEGSVIEQTTETTEEAGKKKTKKLDTFAPAAHDPVTGEIIEQVATQNQAAAVSEADDLPPAIRHQPRIIEAKPLADDATKTDWESYTIDWNKAIAAMADIQSIEKMKKLNEKTLAELAREDLEKYNITMEAATNRFIVLGGMEKAA